MDSLLDNDLEQLRIWLSDLDGIAWHWMGHGLWVSDLELFKTRLPLARHVMGVNVNPPFSQGHGQVGLTWMTLSLTGLECSEHGFGMDRIGKARIHHC